MLLQTQPSNNPNPAVTIEIPSLFGPESLALGVTVAMWAWRRYAHNRLRNLRESLNYTLDWSRDISGVLHVIRSKTDAHRAILLKAHNNVEHLDHSHFWKISARHEVTSPGMSPLSPKLQDISISDYLETLKSCQTSTHQVFLDPSSIKDPVLSNFCKINGIKTYAIYLFSDRQDTPLAYLVLHNFTPESLNQIEGQCDMIDAMLEEFQPPTLLTHLKNILKNT